MNPLEKKIEELQAQIDLMRRGEDLELIENVRRRSLGDVVLSGTSDAASNITKSVDEGGAATYNVTKEPAAAQRITIDGTEYYIALFNL